MFDKLKGGLTPKERKKIVNSLDYVKNRTHYAEVSVIDVLPKNTYTLTDMDGVQAAFLDKAPDFAEEHTYKVTWNGTEYACVCSVLDTTYSKSLYVGNFFIGGGDGIDTGEPFLIISTIEGDGAGTAMILGVAENTEVTVSITEKAEVVHKLDPKYLPAGVGGGLRVIVTIDPESGVGAYVADKTYSEISEAILNGNMPYVVVGNYCLHLVKSDVLSGVMPMAVELLSHTFSSFNGGYEFSCRIEEDNRVYYEEIQYQTT